MPSAAGRHAPVIDSLSTCRMSVLRPKPPEDPIALSLGPLEELSHEPLQGLARVPRDELAAGLGPRRLLDHYMQDRPTSLLFEALATARQLREAVDAVVVVSDSPLGHVVQGLFATCCHPFHNQLSRGERGGRPRLFFDVGPCDPDRTAGLADLVEAADGHDLLNRWGLLQLSTSGTAESPAARQAAWYTHVFAEHRRRYVPPRSTTLDLPLEHDPLADAFTPAVLIAASLAGIDVVRVLTGGAAMLQRFLESPAETNPPLLLAAAMHAAVTKHEASALTLATHAAPAAADLARWWSSQNSVSIAREQPCLLRIGQSRREGPLTPPEPRSPTSAPLPPPAAATVIDLPRLDEHTVGQLLAMRLLAARIIAWQASGG